MEDPQLSTLYDHTSQQLTAASAAQGDLLFAWLAPIGSKVDKRLRPKSPTGGAHSSPLNRARSAFRRTIRSGHVSHKLRGDGAYMAISSYILNCHVARSLYKRVDTPLKYALSCVCCSLLHYSVVSAVREANDACLWLKAAGFPQYVQMFEG